MQHKKSLTDYILLNGDVAQWILMQLAIIWKWKTTHRFKDRQDGVLDVFEIDRIEQWVQP